MSKKKYLIFKNKLCYIIKRLNNYEYIILCGKEILTVFWSKFYEKYGHIKIDEGGDISKVVEIEEKHTKYLLYHCETGPAYVFKNALNIENEYWFDGDILKYDEWLEKIQNLKDSDSH